MKKIFTLLLVLGSVTVSFAQNNKEEHSRNSNNQYSGQASGYSSNNSHSYDQPVATNQGSGAYGQGKNASNGYQQNSYNRPDQGFSSTRNDRGHGQYENGAEQHSYYNNYNNNGRYNQWDYGYERRIDNDRFNRGRGREWFPARQERRGCY